MKLNLSIICNYFLLILLTISNCLTQHQEARFCNFISDIPESCNSSDVSFYLFTRQDEEVGHRITTSSGDPSRSLDASNFNPYNPTKILLHGFNSDMFLSVLAEVKKEYFAHGEYNIFVVDWSQLARGPCYPAAVFNTRVTGRCLALLVEKIQEISLRSVHLIGFSLGAHVAGVAGNRTRRRKVSRITGLDPAMPGFLSTSDEYKLSQDDALFVDVLHTNAFLQGTYESLGHADFFVNGGSVQPGCWAEPRYLACNHHRSVLYFAESINSRVGFMGWPCPDFYEYALGRCPPTDDQAFMGEPADFTRRGNYLVITNSVAPFAVGKYTGPLIEVLIK